MKKIFYLLLLFVFIFSYVNAENDDTNYDYTLIDCVNWDNDLWVVFDSSQPYATLKEWIENTINYINSNVNKVGNENTASWKIFNIKINCSFNDIFNKKINLNFNWVDYNNELLIEWINDNSFIIKNIEFMLWYKSWNIIFKNASFLNENKPYFYDHIPSPWGLFQPRTHPLSNWIKIIDSYIKLTNWNNLWHTTNYMSYNYRYYNKTHRDSLYNYSNKHIIENSILDIDIWNDFEFRMPIFMKNSKINFINDTWTWIYNIKFLEDWNINNQRELNYSVFISNEINLWWNNFLSENTINIAFLNNNFINFKEFNFWGSWIYINNFIQNTLKVDISNFKNLYNNIISNGFTDTYDIFNYRKNYSSNNVLWKWIWWIYKRLSNNKYFNIDIDSSVLYKEITGIDLINGLWDIYVIFNY